MPILQDDNGMAIKFFIQKDLPEQVQADLCETITALGGRVETKVPRSGYILVHSGTVEEERLKLCWASPDRPGRHFVPYTYVEACKNAGMLLKQIFVRNGEPIKMHIHPSIANINARAALSLRIVHSGGDPTASAQSATVILADPNTEVFEHLIKSFQGVPDKYIESYLWVKKCAEKGALAFTPLVYKNPGGRRPGEERTQFTEEDEKHLCAWIASKIPFKDTGGRTGNRLYQQLCDMAENQEYAWVTRHTWQSWRERYKKNAERLDNVISAIVAQNRPTQGEGGQYGYVRKTQAKPRRPRKKRIEKAGERPITSDEEFMRSMEQETPVSAMLPSHVPGLLYPQGPIAVPVDTQFAGPSMIAIRRSPAEEELEDEGSEWAVKIGNEPPPLWTSSNKRRLSPESGSNSPDKRQKIMITSSDQSQLVLPSTSTSLPAGVHLVDHALSEIAKEYRFTLEEVKEYYDKCGEMERTRLRFQKMRQELNAKFAAHE